MYGNILPTIANSINLDAVTISSEQKAVSSFCFQLLLLLLLVPSVSKSARSREPQYSILSPGFHSGDSKQFDQITRFKKPTEFQLVHCY